MGKDKKEKSKEKLIEEQTSFEVSCFPERNPELNFNRLNSNCLEELWP